MLTNIKRPVQHRFACSAENFIIVSESVPIVLWNYDCLTIYYDVFCIYIYTYSHIKSSSRNNCSPLTIHNVVDMWNGCLNNRRWTAILRTKFSSAVKHISHSVDMLINKIVAFGFLWIFK